MSVQILTATRFGLELPDGTTLEEWTEIGRTLCLGQQSMQWKIGDWWAFGEHRYGQRAKIAAEGVFGLSFGTLATYASVSRAFECSMRIEHLSFAHHQVAAGLSSAEAKEVLDRAVSENLSTRDLRRHVQGMRPPSPANDDLQPDLIDQAELAAMLVRSLERWKAGEQFTMDDEANLVIAKETLLRHLGFRARQIYEFVRDAFHAERPTPSYAKIANALGMNSISDVCNVVRRLERRGLLSRCDTGSRHRRGWHQSVILSPTT